MKTQTLVLKMRAGKFQLLMLTLIMISLLGCGTVKNSMTGENVTGEKTSSILVRIGTSSGGVIENKKMDGLPGAGTVDAITGATKNGVNLGVHTQIDLKGHQIETGLDYIFFNQSVKYEMPTFSVNGQRDFKFHQIRLPLTYNLRFFKNAKNHPVLILRPGISIGYTFSKSISASGNIPDYQFKNWNVGPAFGISVYPLQYKQRFRIGAYLDMFRGGRIYQDMYHNTETVGGQSYWMFGITLQPLTSH